MYTSDLLPFWFTFIHDKLACFLVYFSHMKQKGWKVYILTFKNELSKQKAIKFGPFYRDFLPA